MAVYQAFRFELDPNDRTKAALSSHCGASAFSYNWGLFLVKERLAKRDQIRAACYEELLSDEETERLVETVEVPWNLYSLRREWNRQKCVVAPWWKENSKEAYSSGLSALGRALEAFSKSKKSERRGTIGFPRRKKKNRAKRSCRFTTGAIKVADVRHVQLPRIGVVRTKELTTKLRELLDAGRGRILSATISQAAGRWFVSFACEVERQDAPALFPKEVVGVDLGVTHLAVLSTGRVVENPKALTRYEKRMKRSQRQLSRQKLGSRCRERTKKKLARCHQKVADVRRDALHKLTTELATTYPTVVVEDLNVKAMTSTPKPKLSDDGFADNGRRQKAGLNRSILDTSPAEFRRQLSYKLAWCKGTMVVADRFFPSSKICSTCGAVKAKLSLDERTYRCEHCGLEIDRDLNAALNLAAYGRRVIAGSGPEMSNARGGGHPRPLPKPPAKREDGTAHADRTVTVSPQGEAA